MDAAPAPLSVDYFDGQSTRPRPARVRVSGAALVIETGDARARRIALADVQWPERQRHGARVAHLAGGGALHARGDDALAWDAFMRSLPRAAGRESWVVRAQQSWRLTFAAVALLIGAVAAGYRWGVPLAARGVLAALPADADAAIGRVALDSVDGRWLAPSRIGADDRARIEAAFARLVEQALPANARPAYTLRFHASRIGPNAFALPGGTIVITDELIKLAAGRDDLLLGVLAHELGHVQARHGMRLLVQVSLLGAATSVALGDFSAVLAGAPALLGQLAYSRDAEREADAFSVRLMKAGGISPAVMVEFFERARDWRRSEEGQRHGGGADLGIAFSSHPADAERMATLRDAAR